MSATSYYATKARAGARTERIGVEMARSSAYIMDSSSLTSRTSSYTSTLGRQGSFRDTGRSRVRDTSVDCAVRTSRRSSSMDHSAPVKLRPRDLSTDCSSRSYSKPAYTASNRAPRPVTTSYDNDDDHSEEYKKILGKVTDVSLTLSKYAKKDTDALKVEGMMEEERRGKAYSKIINQSSTAQIEKDAYRNTMCDIFADTKSFSAKTMQAINKECLYKEDKGPKNYGWRKDMDSYEENLERVSEHKKALRQSTLATRDAAGPRYKDVNAKMRDYDRECRRDVDDMDVTPVRRVTVTVTTPTLDRKTYKAPESTSSYSNGTSAYSNGTSSYNNGSSYSSNREREDTTTTSTPKRGSWRKDIEAYEDKLTKPKPTLVINRNVEPKEEAPKVYSWQKKEETKPVEVETPKVYSWQKSSSTTATTSSSTVSTSKYSAKTEEVMAAPVAVKKEEPNVAETPRWKKPDAVKLEETKTVETKPPPSCKKPEITAKVEETKVESKLIAVTPKQEEVKPSTTTSKWKKPEAAHVAEPKAESPKAMPKSEEPKPAQIPKVLPKSVESKKDEPKPETPKATPKWKKPETTAKPAEAKPETPKATPKWKKPEAAAKPAEEKTVEPPKPAPKWGKKAEPAKKPEEPKPEEPKAVPKWKKTGTAAKKEEPKPVEEPKPSPKWKKPETAKKEEPKPAEPEKPAPKWGKKPEAKKEVAKPAEAEKPTPKWKKPTVGKKEEPVAVPVEEQVEEVKVVVEESRLKPAVEDTPAETNEESKEINKEEAVEKKDGEEEKKEEEEEDHYGMKAMAKEMHAKQTAMDEEFAQGASKLSALRQKMKAMRAKHKAAADADAAAEAARQG